MVENRFFALYQFLDSHILFLRNARSLITLVVLNNMQPFPNRFVPQFADVSFWKGVLSSSISLPVNMLFDDLLFF